MLILVLNRSLVILHNNQDASKGIVGLALIYFMLILVISPLELKMYYFKNYVVFLYGVFLWYLEGTMVQSVCVDMMKALRGVWSVNNRTHRDIITSLSKQFIYFEFEEEDYQNYQQLFVILEQYCTMDSDDKLSYMLTSYVCKIMFI